MASVKHIIITPETHWDREWYLPFQSYRAKLVLLIDRLLDLIKEIGYPNFTLDGQSVVIQDYLEIRPEKEAEIRKAVTKGQISLGPMYVLPDEYLVSGEALIRNFMLGIKIARNFGKAMNAAYIPDPFGHVAQLPQIAAGFDLPIILFARGFGNEFEAQKLNMEFVWDAPGQAASAIGVHLIDGYGSVAGLSEIRDKKGVYSDALKRIERVVDHISKFTISDTVLLNNGTDHHFAQPAIPEIVTQWNANNSNQMVQADFGTYAEKILPFRDQMKHYSGELHGGKYQLLLSGILSTRMWIKQENYRVQTLLERYAEPTAVLEWILSKAKYPFPSGHLWNAWSTLLKNHPHDSICGCSIDEVHDVDMKARFFNAGTLAMETIKESLYRLSSLVAMDDLEGERIGFLVFNPLPWNRTEIVRVKVFISGEGKSFDPSILDELTIKDEAGMVYPAEIEKIQIPPNISMYEVSPYELRFIAKDVPALGYKVYYLYPGEKPRIEDIDKELEWGNNWIENRYYKVSINPNGSFDVLDKETKLVYPNMGLFEDSGDWGDEYDYSGPGSKRLDKIITSMKCESKYDLHCGPVTARAEISVKLNIPSTLSEDIERKHRNEDIKPVLLQIHLELPIKEKIIKIGVKWNNSIKDHRLRMLFPSGLKVDQIEADGHFYVIPRTLTSPDDKKWSQKWVPTHHQHKFVTVADEKQSVTVLNKGLPEYEGIRLKDGSVTIAITLLRSIGWLSRHDLATRSGNAGPSIATPGAQCIGDQTVELALTTDNKRWLDAGTYWRVENYHAPLIVAVPASIGSHHRIMDMISLTFGAFRKVVSYESTPILPAQFSLLKISNPKITLTACKKAENEDALIIRLLNLSNSPQTDSVCFGLPLESAEIVNYNEEVPKKPIKAKVSIGGELLDIKLDPYVLVTIMLKFKR